MRFRPNLVSALTFAALSVGVSAYAASSQKNAAEEDYLRAPLPPGFQVISTELEGPVFATSGGMTLYQWPMKPLRNGDAGEQKGKPSCDDHKYTENAGLMSPYPGGFILPDVERRMSCVQLWPPVLAADDAKPVDKWTIVKRPDGTKQWAYDGFAVYTSILDKKPGDVIGATKRRMVGRGRCAARTGRPEAERAAGFCRDPDRGRPADHRCRA